MKQPASDPRPPNTTTTNTIGPMAKAMRGLGDVVVAADHAGEAGQHGAAGEHDGEDPRHVVAERAHHVGMVQRRLDDQADARARQQPARSRPNISAEISSMKAR